MARSAYGHPFKKPYEPVLYEKERQVAPYFTAERLAEGILTDAGEVLDEIVRVVVSHTV